IELNRSTYEISDEGLIVYPSLPSDIPAAFSDQRMRTNISGLDDLIGGGLFRRSFTAITGGAGAGKTTLALEFACKCARDLGEKALFVSYDEAKEQLELELRNLGFAESEDLERKGLLIFESISPERFAPDAHLVKLERLLSKTKPSLVIFDGIVALQSICSSQSEFYFFSKKLARMTKVAGSTSVCCITTHHQSGGFAGLGIGLSTVLDNLILLQSAETEGQISRFIIIEKMRGSAHTNSIRHFEIRRGGIVITEEPVPYSGILTGNARKILGEFEQSEKGIASQAEIARVKRATKFKEDLSRSLADDWTRGAERKGQDEEKRKRSVSNNDKSGSDKKKQGRKKA
ncbi:MAG: RAD55 family ATPase, partial [Nitrososphaerales archaeon]